MLVRRSVLSTRKPKLQMVGPQTGKARWPNCVPVRWTIAARDVVERWQPE